MTPEGSHSLSLVSIKTFRAPVFPTLFSFCSNVPNSFMAMIPYSLKPLGRSVTNREGMTEIENERILKLVLRCIRLYIRYYSCQMFVIIIFVICCILLISGCASSGNLVISAAKTSDVACFLIH